MPLLSTRLFKFVGGNTINAGAVNYRKFSSVPIILKNTLALKTALHRIAPYTKDNYLHDHFTHWVTLFAREKSERLENYFQDKRGLDQICSHFIKFCFERGISLDKSKTLQSFEYHDALSDSAVKRELAKISKSVEEINLLGFGLGDGYYEKSIAQYLIDSKKANKVKIYGFDPYAEKSEGVELLTTSQLASNSIPKFNLITARWVLHHVELQKRWDDLIKCINHAQEGSLVLIVEHGFLQQAMLPSNQKLYYLLNATFDVVANIGIRPAWFTDTAPDIGKHFYIHYLTPYDFDVIKKGVKIQTTQILYDVGPGFPNQTICSMQLR